MKNSGIFVRGFTTGNDNLSVNSITYTPGEWSNEAITISINEENITHVNELAEAPYSFDGGKTWQKENSKTYTENVSEVDIKIKDINNNTASYVTSIKGIEKTKPSSEKPTAEVSLYSITVTCNQQDNESGIEKIEYAIYDEENSTWKWQETNKFEGLKEGTTYKIKTKATDKAGNYEESEEAETTTQIDNIKPEIKSVEDKTEKINGYTKTAKIEIKAEDNESGLKNIEIKSQDGTIDVTQALESDTITLEITENGTYTITVYDNRENISEPVQIIINNIDSTGPQVEYKVMNKGGASRDENNKWVPKLISKEITIEATDTESGIEGEAYSFDGGKTWQKENSKTYTENVEKVTIVVKDALGNQTSKEPFEIIEFDNPIIKGVKNETWHAEDIEIEFIKTDKAYYYYSKEGTENYGEQIEITDTSATKSFTENGYYKIVAENKNGKKYEITFGIDKEAPKITKVINGDIIGTEEEKGAIIRIESEANSGISSIKYYDNGSWHSIAPNMRILMMNGITTKFKVVNKAGIESEEYYYTMNLNNTNTETQVFSGSGKVEQQLVNRSKEINLNEETSTTNNEEIEETAKEDKINVEQEEKVENNIQEASTNKEKAESKIEEKHTYTLTDVVQIQKTLVGIKEYNENEMKYLDINQDGQINLIDLVKVLNKLVE